MLIFSKFGIYQCLPYLLVNIETVASKSFRVCPDFMAAAMFVISFNLTMFPGISRIFLLTLISKNSQPWLTAPLREIAAVEDA